MFGNERHCRLPRSRARSKVACTQQEMRRVVSGVDTADRNGTDRSPSSIVGYCKFYDDVLNYFRGTHEYRDLFRYLVTSGGHERRE